MFSLGQMPSSVTRDHRIPLGIAPRSDILDAEHSIENRGTEKRCQTESKKPAVRHDHRRTGERNQIFGYLWRTNIGCKEV